MTWKNLHQKGLKNRPGINEIMAFFPEEIGNLFQEFSRHLAREYDVGCKPPAYTETSGWTYAFGRYDIHLLNRVTLEDSAFTVQGLRVHDEASYREALKLAASLYDDYKTRFNQAVAIKKEKQKQNTAKRKAWEKAELETLLKTIDKERFYKYRWSPKLSRQILKKLYTNDAAGIKDEDLADEVGFTLYARCLQGQEEGSLKDAGKLKCHHCKEILQAKSNDSLMECPCGYQYIFREYRRAFRTNNMPHGAAQAIFNAFVENWPKAKDYPAKMILIDNLVHEFHINLNSGVKGRFVGVNLIEGTKKQIGDLILELAYGDGSNTAKFIANLSKE